ncbi:uncharacterized protein MEPE_00047 [Melanopsichium pennsylvanicum]|uniref:RING-type domain-containing protein n=2 Tax=Melanopsichium pennsylvanicum TaxID=63383 RepID=A0AAJ4XFV8_9BASI|nr:putative protein [Melanopsichium pennsylvanicum 4]SNX81342.1 uncharacterized protein MEPE_00047 [Melanopsichium pennsylvanicum]
MLPSLSLTSTSLDQFRKNVYRPRLCLLLLLVLLSPHNTSQLTSTSDDFTIAISQPAQPGWSISMIDGLVVAAPPPASELVSSATAIKPVKRASSAASKGAPAEPSPAPSIQKNKETSQQGQPPPGSLFRFPKLSWRLIVDEHVLPALLLLHVLWAIRLAGIAVEDGVVKNTLLGAKSRFHSVTLPLVYLAVLCALAILTGQPGTVNLIRDLCCTWRAKLGFESFDPQPTNGESRLKIFQVDGLLPPSLFVMLETAATVVHLLSILPKVDAERISSILPVQLKLPSPSHSPPLVELLPLPTSVKAALTEPMSRSATVRYGVGRRRPMMPNINPAAPPPTTLDQPASQQQSETQGTATTTAIDASHIRQTEDVAEAIPQQRYRRVGAPENEVLLSTSVASPIAPLTLPENTPLTPSSHRRRAPRLGGQSVLVSTKWLSETVTSLFDKLIGALIYSIVTLRLPTLSPTSLPPVLSLLGLRSELASLTQIWSKARGSVECLEFVRRRWGVALEDGQDPYEGVIRPRAAKEAGDYGWKSYEAVFCAICFEQTRSAAVKKGSDGEKDDESEKKIWEFCRLDCGHELHDVCLVSWLTAQAFCPTCHVVLSFSPRAATGSRRGTAQT